MTGWELLPRGHKKRKPAEDQKENKKKKEDKKKKGIRKTGGRSAAACREKEMEKNGVCFCLTVRTVRIL